MVVLIGGGEHQHNGRRAIVLVQLCDNEVNLAQMEIERAWLRDAHEELHLLWLRVHMIRLCLPEVVMWL